MIFIFFLHLQTWLYLVLCYLWESKHLHKPINSSLIFKLLTCSVSRKTPVSVLYDCYTCSYVTVQLLDIFSTSCAWLVCGSSFRAIDHFIPCDMITPVMIWWIVKLSCYLQYFKTLPACISLLSMMVALFLFRYM